MKINNYGFLFENNTEKQNNGINLSEYASIKSGSYKKAVKAYYEKQKEDNVDVNTKTNNNVKIKSNIDNIKGSIKELRKETNWVKNKDTDDYDWGKITKNVQSFVDNYNNLLDEVENSDNKKVLRNSVWLVHSLRTNDNILKDVGITIGLDNKLDLNEDKLKKSNIYTLDYLFTGHNSLLNNIDRKINNIDKELTRNTRMYDKTGNYIN